MWRTSWMSREVIVLPAFIGLVALWVLTEWTGQRAPWTRLLPVLAIVGAVALWYCTAMIYACLRFIEEWAHPLTIINFTLIGLASGLLLACALAALANVGNIVAATGASALAATIAAWITRGVSLRRNAGIRHKSTLQSATGIQAPILVQKSMGMSAGAFNTREFFHGASQRVMANARVGFQLVAFAVPAVLMAWAIYSHSSWPWVLALLVQAPGLIAERWVFFAQAKHPQNLYYQVVS
jgi:DMSO reductase anchor subunit